jgi:hypothetical protein
MRTALMATHPVPPPPGDGSDEVWALTDDPEDDPPTWPEDRGVSERDPR